MLKMLVFGNLKFPVQNISVFLDGFSLCWKKYNILIDIGSWNYKRLSSENLG